MFPLQMLQFTDISVYSVNNSHWLILINSECKLSPVTHIHADNQSDFLVTESNIPAI